MSNLERYQKTIVILTVVLIAFFVSLYYQWLTFPTFQYAPFSIGRQLVPSEPYYDIAGHASRFMWENRALDLTGQAFVISAAVICCLALLKPEEGGH